MVKSGATGWNVREILTMWAIALQGCTASEPPAGSAPATSATTRASAVVPSPGTASTQAAMGRATLKGVIAFSGKAPPMKVPHKRKDADFCKDREVPYNAVLVADGKLRDVLVRLAAGSVPGPWMAPEKHLEVHQTDCMYAPRIQGAMTGQTLEIVNDDQTLHNAHPYRNGETLWGTAQPKGSGPVIKDLPDEPFLLKVTCDVHPWMRGFVVITDHPFFAVSGDDGRYAIESVPAGKYTVEAWHSQYGLLQREQVVVGSAGEVVVDFEYEASMPEPAENRGELTGLW